MLSCWRGPVRLATGTLIRPLRPFNSHIYNNRQRGKGSGALDPLPSPGHLPPSFPWRCCGGSCGKKRNPTSCQPYGADATGERGRRGVPTQLGPAPRPCIHDRSHAPWMAVHAVTADGVQSGRPGGSSMVQGRAAGGRGAPGCGAPGAERLAGRRQWRQHKEQPAAAQACERIRRGPGDPEQLRAAAG